MLKKVPPPQKKSVILLIIVGATSIYSLNDDINESGDGIKILEHFLIQSRPLAKSHEKS